MWSVDTLEDPTITNEHRLEAGHTRRKEHHLNGQIVFPMSKAALKVFTRMSRTDSEAQANPATALPLTWRGSTGMYISCILHVGQHCMTLGTDGSEIRRELIHYSVPKTDHLQRDT